MSSQFKGQGKGKKQVACTLSIQLFNRLGDLAKASSISRSDYVRRAVSQAITSNTYYPGAADTKGLPIANLPPPIDIEEVLAARAAEEPPEYKTPKHKKSA